MTLRHAYTALRAALAREPARRPLSLPETATAAILTGKPEAPTMAKRKHPAEDGSLRPSVEGVVQTSSTRKSRRTTFVAGLRAALARKF